MYILPIYIIIIINIKILYTFIYKIRIVGITDYEAMYADAIKIMKSMHGISSAQVFTIRPRRGASSEETGVDVHYMTNFSRGTFIVLVSV